MWTYLLYVNDTFIREHHDIDTLARIATKTAMERYDHNKPGSTQILSVRDGYVVERYDYTI